MTASGKAVAGSPTPTPAINLTQFDQQNLNQDRFRNLQDSFDAFTENGYEWKQEHSILLSPSFGPAFEWQRRGVFVLKSFCNLDAPLVLELAYAEKGGTHNGDDYRGNQSEHALPDVLSRLEGVPAGRIESTNYASADTEAYEEAQCDPEPDLESLLRL